MKLGFANIGMAIAVAMLCSSVSQVTAQDKTFEKLKKLDEKRVERGYGPDADQTAHGEPPAKIVEQYKKLPTPKAADGHPDLSGFWGAAGWGYTVSFGKLSADGKTYDIDNPVGTAEKPSRVAAAKAAEASRPRNDPPYKPEYAEKVKDLSGHWMLHDPTFFCGLSGFPRLGPPTEIVQTKDALYFLYQTLEQLNTYRIIPLDGRKHDDTLNPSYLGDAVGRWEGDKMIIDDVNFADETWIAREAPIHSDQLHTVETISREGNVLFWQVSIEDPKVFTKPWVQKKTLIVGLKGGHPLEELPCKEQDAAHIPDR